MNMSASFKKRGWNALTVLFIFTSMYILTKALKLRIPVRTAYAVWVASGL